MSGSSTNGVNGAKNPKNAKNAKKAHNTDHAKSSGSADAGAAIGDEVGARFARAKALAVLRVRGRALGAALLPAAVAVVLLAAGGTGRLEGQGWDTARWAVSCFAAAVLLLAGAVAVVVQRAEPALSPTVAVAEKSAPDLYRLVRDLAERLGVPGPSSIALTPDCDSWLEDRTHPSHAARPAGGGRGRPAKAAPVLVVGSPFLWWMRVAELRAVLAPVVAGTGPAAHPDIAAARRFVRGLDAAVAVAARRDLGPVRRAALAPVGRIARLMLRGCGEHAALMERGVATAASERAQAVDYGLRIVAQEQVGLAYAGWDRLLTRVALPAWRMGRWPARLDAGVVSALTELSRRDRLAEGFASRLGERPACDLLEEPGAVDEAASLLAARLFHGGPAEAGPDWSPVDWQHYPEEVVDRTWRTEAARLHRVLDELGVRNTGGPDDRTGQTDLAGQAGPTLDRVLDHLSRRQDRGEDPYAGLAYARVGGQHAGPGPRAGAPRETAAAAGDPEALLGDPYDDSLPVVPPGLEALDAEPGAASARSDARAEDSASPSAPTAPAPQATPAAGGHAGDADGPAAPDDGPAAPDRDACAAADAATAPATTTATTAATGPATTASADALAARISAEIARETASPHGCEGRTGGRSARATDSLPLVPLQPPRTGRELLADHVTAMICCSAVDTAGALPGLDWLDGPTLLVGGERRSDLGGPVHSLVEDGDPGPLRSWLASLGIRPEKPVRLV
ncbi:hypothetical protein AB0910_28105 [Streptomyces sp. NPDC047002]|uniref:hypothetical protein n=1 Tax=Streptomyces sp. NPDC047002 TaxID=3155475 RepID=UPI003453552B